jgi:inosose dehydratase
MTSARIAGAPISWGVCEVPDWGHQLSADRVLAEMREIGLEATEFGPPGFLPAEPAALAAQLADYGLQGVGGFLPVVVHDSDHDPLPEVDAFIAQCRTARAEVVVLAAATGQDGYDARPELDDVGWKTLLTNLDRVNALAADRHMVLALHPHVGTMVETGAEVDRVLAGSTVGLCVDTGHLLVGGADPVALTRDHVGRVRHVHLKDVDGELARQVTAGSLTFADAVRAGLWVRLGEGSVDVAAMIRTLHDNDYEGWYVLEQDVMLDGEPDGGPDNQGPVADVRACLDYVRAAVA